MKILTPNCLCQYLFFISFDLHFIIQTQENSFFYHNNSHLINLMPLFISFSKLED